MTRDESRCAHGALPSDQLAAQIQGGSRATRSHLIRNTYRNLFQPDRRDIIARFRTCAA